MLKKIYITSLVLLIGVGNILIMQNQSKVDQFSQKGILGVFDVSKIIIQNKPVKQPVVESTNLKAKPELPLSQTKQVEDAEIKLEGNGCGENKAPNVCKVVNNQKPGEILKQCDENSWDKCNFYLYQLGKREGDIQYILQTYTENTDRLLDVLEYNVKTNIVSQIKTTLFQENLPSNSNTNIEYTTTLNQYK